MTGQLKIIVLVQFGVMACPLQSQRNWISIAHPPQPTLKCFSSHHVCKEWLSSHSLWRLSKFNHSVTNLVCVKIPGDLTLHQQPRSTRSPSSDIGRERERSWPESAWWWSASSCCYLIGWVWTESQSKAGLSIVGEPFCKINTFLLESLEGIQSEIKWDRYISVSL